MIDQFPLIPDQAFLYLPESDRITEIRHGKNHRIIFGGGVQFDQQQVQIIQNLRNNIRNVRDRQYLLLYPNHFLLRFLQATAYNYKQCIEALQVYHKWQISMKQHHTSNQYSRYLGQGIIYLCGRDYHFRPIIIINIKKLLQIKIKQQQLMKLFGFYFQYIIDSCLIEGQVQTWNTIIDLGYCGVFSLGGTLVQIIKYMSSIFRARSNHTFLIKCPSSIKIVWGMIKGVLNQDQLRKISISGKEVFGQEVFNKINHNQIEMKYGGTRSNITNYWPIQIVPYTFEVKDKTVWLISQQDYYRLYNQGKLKDRKIKKLFIDKISRSRQTMPSSTYRQQQTKITQYKQQQVLYPQQVQPLQPNRLEQIFTFKQNLLD